MTRVACLQTIKDLLLYGVQDTRLDESLQDQWQQSLTELSRSHTLFASSLTLPAVVNESVYSVPDNTTRIVSVAFDKKTLGYTDRANLDLENPDWIAAEGGTPRVWSDNALPGEIGLGLQTFTPQEFLLVPAPDGSVPLATAITVIYEHIPDEAPLWVEPLLLYASVGALAQENPSLMEPEKAAWFAKVFELWDTVSKPRLQI
jgi:hypothetical protein